MTWAILMYGTSVCISTILLTKELWLVFWPEVNQCLLGIHNIVDGQEVKLNLYWLL